MIIGFRDRETERVWHGHLSKRWPVAMQDIARRKLRLIDAATMLDSLRIPPGNRLEALRGTRKGQHSIRVNDRWRICFVWKDGNAHDVEIVDYH